MTQEDEDTLSALAGRAHVRLDTPDRAKVRTIALAALAHRHAAEYRDLLDSEAARLLELRARRGLW